MNEAPQTVFLAHNISEVTFGEPLEKWPLHMTITPPFNVDRVKDPLPTIDRIIRASGQEIGPIELSFGQIRSGSIPLEIGQRALYGDAEDIPVIEILDPSGKLHELHNRLMRSLGAVGCRFIDLRWALNKYSPHATTKSGLVLNKPFFCDRLSINVKQNGLKTVVEDVSLCDKSSF